MAALAQHDRLDMPLETVRTMIVLGQVQRRRRSRTSGWMCVKLPTG